MENFVQANPRIITQETVFQKALRSALPARDQIIVMYVFETKNYISDHVLTAYTLQITMNK